MRFSIVKALLCLALLFSYADAQQSPTSTTPAKNTAALASKDSSVTVYVYRYRQYLGSALSPSVYCDETELARMDNGKFFVVKLSPGKHTFRSNDKQAGIDEELSGGHDYYIRVELAAGFLKGHGRLVSVVPEQGAYEIKQLKPLAVDKVKDTQLVVPASAEGN